MVFIIGICLILVALFYLGLAFNPWFYLGVGLYIYTKSAKLWPARRCALFLLLAFVPYFLNRNSALPGDHVAQEIHEKVAEQNYESSYQPDSIGYEIRKTILLLAVVVVAVIVIRAQARTAPVRAGR